MRPQPKRRSQTIGCYRSAIQQMDKLARTGKSALETGPKRAGYSR
jgi:hypothetical protein